MAFAVIMPKAGMSMETGRVVRWLRNVGDTVKVGEPLLEIETDKVTMEVEAEASGTLTQILCGPGTEVPVTTVIGWLGDPGEASPDGRPDGSPAPAQAPKPTQASPGREAPRLLSEGGSGSPATPLARTLARESGIDIATVKPTGARGEVKARDVRGAREKQAGQGPLASGTLLSLLVEADVTDLEALRGRVNEGLHIQTSLTDWLIRAVALAIQDHPAIGGATTGDRVDIGISSSDEENDRVPVIRDAASLSVGAIARVRDELAGKARSGVLSDNDCMGAAFTLTSLASSDIIALTPAMAAGQGAALSAGCLRDSLARAAGAVVQRKLIFLSLTRDRRLVSATEAMQFLATLRACLANPAALLA